MNMFNPFSSPNSQAVRNANNDRIAGIRINRARAYRNAQHKAEAKGNKKSAKFNKKMAEQNEKEANFFFNL